MKDIIRDLADKDQHNLKLRFQVGLGIIFFCFCLFTTTIIYHFQKNLLEEETFRQAELVMTSLEATRSYIREVLRPRMYEELGEDQFIIEAMSTSYITRVIMDRFKDALPAFKYRRTAIGARNPSFEANMQEREMIDYFREHPDEQEWHTVKRLDSERYFTIYRPVTFNTSCMHCHGDPENAPSAISRSYGEVRGFHRTADEIGGILSISIPLEESLTQIWKRSFRMFGTVLILALLLYSTIWLLFHQLIITNLRDLLTLFRTTLDVGNKSSLPQSMKGHREELEELFRSARTLVQHLLDSRSRLVEHTDNLELIVAERTEALKRSETRARHQVKKRNKELMLHNTLTSLITSTDNLQSTLHQALHETLQVIPAQGAGIYLHDINTDSYILQTSENAPLLDPEQHKINHKQIKIIPSEKYDMLNVSIPLCCRNRLLGIMLITELRCEMLDDALQELLLSIGQQIGLTIESLQNMQNLRQNTELLQSVFDGISDPLILLEPDGRLQMANQSFLLRNNLNMNEVIGESIDAISSVKQCLFSGQLQELDLYTKKQHVKEIQLDDGSIFDISFYPILNQDNSPQAIVCLAKDVTNIKETEQRIQQTEKLVAVGQLAAGVAHEINNPLGVILCHTDIIKEENRDNTEIYNDISTIERHAENCKRIVADLLDFSRSGESQIIRQSGSVNSAIESVLSMVGQQFKKNQITLSCDLDNNLPHCFMDSRRIQQVLVNLIMNSVHAVGIKGNISITTQSANNQIFIHIDDDGPGISKNILDKIFDPFFSTKEPGQGTGLGLSVSYGIIREHDGEIRVQSTPGHGSRFTIILPTPQKSINDE
jgi:two-component system, NtrC family, sensor kinase